ncbi:MAG: lytic transglycosylase domain-containing protein [Ahrensia sp.]
MKQSRRKFHLFTAALLAIGADTVASGYYYYAQKSQDVATDALITATTKAPPQALALDLDEALDRITDPVAARQIASALAAADAGDRAALDALRRSFAEASAARDALDWALATSAQRAKMLSPRDIDAIQNRLASWPGREAMMRARETAVLDGLLGGAQLALTLGDDDPQTTTGKIAVAKNHLLVGNNDRARALILPLWHSNTLWPALETSIPKDFDAILTVEDHRIRLFNMMVRERISSAERFAVYAQMEPLFDVWKAIIRNQNGIEARLAALPDDLLETPHGIYMRVEYARKRQLFDEAAALLVEAPADEGAQINPDAWWNERRIVSRSLREQGDLETAFAVASAHSGGSPETQVDAAFHAGWYALRGLDDPDRAKPHFEKILAIASGAASRSRAYYWLSQSYRAAGSDAEARQALTKAATFGTTYYGQLAASQLGQPIQLDGSAYDDTDLRLALRQAPVAAALLLWQAGDARAAAALVTGLADTTEDPALITAMIDIFNQRGMHFPALRLAKRAAWIDRDIGQATHPVGALPLDNTGQRADLALAYAIARQESEFRLDAVSSADARGLLQLLPSTARGVAQRLDLPFEAARLTTDAAYNTRLGTQYLAEQLDRFDGSYVLTFIAYNAGPGRAREWIERFGDPRGLALDELVDWIEQIPFPETRGYVQKVMENLIVYKTKLGLKADIAKDLRAGRAT